MLKVHTYLMTFLAAAALALSGVMLASPASASHFAGASGAYGCSIDKNNMTDNYKVSYYYSGLDANNTSAMNWTRAYEINPTNIVTSDHATLTSATDIRVHDGMYTTECNGDWLRPGVSPGLVGMAVCVALKSGTSRCEQHKLMLNQYFTNSTTVTKRRTLTTHESGHTLGLNHRNPLDSSVMVTPLTTLWPDFDAHDVATINANY